MVITPEGKPADLDAGNYFIRDGIVVVVGQTVPIDVSLKLATVTETVTVSGQSPTVDTTSATVAVRTIR